MVLGVDIRISPSLQENLAACRGCEIGKSAAGCEIGKSEEGGAGEREQEWEGEWNWERERQQRGNRTDSEYLESGLQRSSCSKAAVKAADGRR